MYVIICIPDKTGVIFSMHFDETPRRFRTRSHEDESFTFNHEIAYKIAKLHATFMSLQILMRHFRKFRTAQFTFR